MAFIVYERKFKQRKGRDIFSITTQGKLYIPLYVMEKNSITKNHRVDFHCDDKNHNKIALHFREDGFYKLTSVYSGGGYEVFIKTFLREIDFKYDEVYIFKYHKEGELIIIDLKKDRLYR